MAQEKKGAGGSGNRVSFYRIKCTFPNGINMIYLSEFKCGTNTLRLRRTAVIFAMDSKSERHLPLLLLYTPMCIMFLSCFSLDEETNLRRRFSETFHLMETYRNKKMLEGGGREKTWKCPTDRNWHCKLKSFLYRLVWMWLLSRNSTINTRRR